MWPYIRVMTITISVFCVEIFVAEIWAAYTEWKWMVYTPTIPCRKTWNKQIQPILKEITCTISRKNTYSYDRRILANFPKTLSLPLRRFITHSIPQSTILGILDMQHTFVNLTVEKKNALNRRASSGYKWWKPGKQTCHLIRPTKWKDTAVILSFLKCHATLIRSFSVNRFASVTFLQRWAPIKCWWVSGHSGNANSIKLPIMSSLKSWTSAPPLITFIGDGLMLMLA